MRPGAESAAGRLRAHRVVLAGLCAGTAVSYAAWLVGAVVNPGVDELYGYVSELSARDQPASGFFRAGDALAGVLGGCAAVVGALRLPPARTRATTVAVLVGWGGLALFGVATAVDATLTPMDCATFTESGCALREAFGASSTAHELHAFTSTLAGAGALVAMAALTVAARRGVTPLPGPRTGLVFTVVTLGATLATLVALLVSGWAGLFQRIQLAAVSAWLLTTAVAAWRARRTP